MFTPFRHQQGQQQPKQPSVSIPDFTGFQQYQQQPNNVSPFGDQGSPFFNHQMQQGFQGSGQPLVQPQQPQPQQQQQQSSSGDLSDIEKLRKLKQTILSGQHPFFQPVPNPDALASLYLGPHPLSQAYKNEQDQQLGSQAQSNLDKPKVPAAGVQKSDVAAQIGSASVLNAAKRPQTPSTTSNHISRGSLVTPQSMSPGAFNSSGSHHQAHNTTNGSVGSSRADHNGGRPHPLTFPPKSHEFRTSTPSPLPPNSARSSSSLPPQQHQRGSLVVHSSSTSGANHEQNRVPPPTSATASAPSLSDSVGVNKPLPPGANDVKDAIAYKDAPTNALSPGGLERDRERDHDRERPGYLPYDSPRFSQPTDRRDGGRHSQRYADPRLDRDRDWARGKDWEGDKDREREKDRERDRVRDRFEYERPGRPTMDRRPAPPPSASSTDLKPAVPPEQRPMLGLGPSSDQRRSEVLISPEERPRPDAPIHPEQRHRSVAPIHPEQRPRPIAPIHSEHRPRTELPVHPEQRPYPEVTMHSEHRSHPEVLMHPEQRPRPDVLMHPEQRPRPEVLPHPEQRPRSEVSMNPEHRRPNPALQPEQRPRQDVLIRPEQRPSPAVPMHPDQRLRPNAPVHSEERRVDLPSHSEQRHIEVPAHSEQRSSEAPRPHIEQHSRRSETNPSRPTPAPPSERRPEPAAAPFSNQSPDRDRFCAPPPGTGLRPGPPTCLPQHPLHMDQRSAPVLSSADHHTSNGSHVVPSSDHVTSFGNSTSMSGPPLPETTRRSDTATTSVGRPSTGAPMDIKTSHSIPERRLTHSSDPQPLPPPPPTSEARVGQGQGQDDRSFYPNVVPSGVPRTVSRASSPGPRRPVDPSYDASRERGRTASIPSTTYRELPPPSSAAPSRSYPDDPRRQPLETNVPRRVPDNFYPPPPSPVPPVPPVVERRDEVRHWRERESYPAAPFSGPDVERERTRKYETREWHGDAYNKEREPRAPDLDAHPRPRPPPPPPPVSWDRDRPLETRDKDKDRDGYETWSAAERKYPGPGAPPVPPPSRWEDPAIHPHRPLHTRLTDTYDERFIPREVAERSRYPPPAPNEVLGFRENPRVRQRSPSPTRRPGVYDDAHRAPKRPRDEFETPSRVPYEYPPRVPSPQPYYDPRAPGLANPRDPSPYGRDRVADPFNRRDMPPPRSPPYYARDRYPPR